MIVEDAVDLVRPLAAEREIDVETPTPGQRHLECRPTASGSSRCCSTCCPTRSSTTGHGGTVRGRLRARPPTGRVRDRRPTPARHPADKWPACSRRSTAWAPSSTEVEGTGLGLALTQAAGGGDGRHASTCEQRGGGQHLHRRAAAESRAEPSASEAPAARRRPGPAPDGDEATILYVEDNLSNLRLVEQILARRPGLRLIPAMQGALGLELARQHRPDLILLDLHLPDLQGARCSPG